MPGPFGRGVIAACQIPFPHSFNPLISPCYTGPAQIIGGHGRAGLHQPDGDPPGGYVQPTQNASTHARHELPGMSRTVDDHAAMDQRRCTHTGCFGAMTRRPVAYDWQFQFRSPVDQQYFPDASHGARERRRQAWAIWRSLSTWRRADQPGGPSDEDDAALLLRRPVPSSAPSSPS